MSVEAVNQVGGQANTHPNQTHQTGRLHCSRCVFKNAFCNELCQTIFLKLIKYKVYILAIVILLTDFLFFFLLMVHLTLYL